LGHIAIEGRRGVTVGPEDALAGVNPTLMSTGGNKA